MTNDWQIIWESDFKIIDKKELEKIEDLGELENLNNLSKKSNLKYDLINLWLLDYDNLSEEEKKIFDELENEKRDEDFYEI
jgi:hypothetical protein